MPVQSSSGNVIQIVQRTTQDTANYSSVNYQNTDVYCDITPKFSSSKFYIQSMVQYGMGDHDVAVSCNYTDSLVSNPLDNPLAPHSTTGGDNNGSANQRMAGYFGFGSFASANTVDNWYVGQIFGSYLYTPGYQNTTTRRLRLCVRTSEGRLFRINMNGQNNTTNPMDVRLRSHLTIMEIGA
tara:strand:+ start:78 stop:623 length:546 start_codon:yes stop_codon:yes gene_type:complete